MKINSRTGTYVPEARYPPADAPLAASSVGGGMYSPWPTLKHAETYRALPLAFRRWKSRFGSVREQALRDFRRRAVPQANIGNERLHLKARAFVCRGRMYERKPKYPAYGNTHAKVGDYGP